MISWNTRGVKIKIRAFVWKEPNLSPSPVGLGQTNKEALQIIIILQKYSVYLHENVAFAVLQIVQISVEISVHRTTFFTSFLRPTRTLFFLW